MRRRGRPRRRPKMDKTPSAREERAGKAMQMVKRTAAAEAQKETRDRGRVPTSRANHKVAARAKATNMKSRRRSNPRVVIRGNAMRSRRESNKTGTPQRQKVTTQNRS